LHKVVVVGAWHERVEMIVDHSVRVTVTVFLKFVAVVTIDSKAVAIVGEVSILCNAELG
jgi:hypothetical protein